MPEATLAEPAVNPAPVTIRFNRSHNSVQITAEEMPIDAHWNSFDDIPQAIEYFRYRVVAKPGVKYGVRVKRADLWDFVS